LPCGPPAAVLWAIASASASAAARASIAVALARNAAASAAAASTAAFAAAFARALLRPAPSCAGRGGCCCDMGTGMPPRHCRRCSCRCCCCCCWWWWWWSSGHGACWGVCAGTSCCKAGSSSVLTVLLLLLARARSLRPLQLVVVLALSRLFGGRGPLSWLCIYGWLASMAGRWEVGPCDGAAGVRVNQQVALRHGSTARPRTNTVPAAKGRKVGVSELSPRSK
jgi:hypothetical protein